MFLLVGGESEIGTATHAYLSARGMPCVATTRRPELAAQERPLLDLAALPENWQPPPATQAACIFAAKARLADCAADPAGSAHINVTQTLALAERLLARGIYVLFLSTNQVFDGETPHVPADAPPSPVSEYGRQKARTEAALRPHIEQGEPAAILRLAKVMSPRMPLMEQWIAALAAGRPIRAFHDMVMAPTPTTLVSEAVARLLAERARGIFQLTGPCDVSYAEIGRYLAGCVGADPRLVATIAADSAGMPPGATPKHTTLDSNALAQKYKLKAPSPWELVHSLPALDRRGSQPGR
jgi:dTDP-4-dehydrorhamnose reductase